MAVKQFKGKVFYPVLYAGDAAAALEASTVVNNKQKEVPVFRESGLCCEEMRKGIGGMLGTEDVPGRIARAFEAARPEVFRFPTRGEALVFHTRNGCQTDIVLTGMRIILFETRVAFFEMDFDLSNLPLADAMNATYYLCELKDEANHFEYERRTFDVQTRQTGSEHVSFSLKEWFLQCASYLPGCRNFEDRSLASTVSKPLLYGYYLLDEQPEELNRLAYNIAQNYKASYKGTEGDSRHMLPAFDNSYWCASYNGAVNISCEVDDPVTNNFFATTFPHKWESEYLFLFLNTIHQKYAVLKYLAELGSLSSSHYDYALMKDLLLQGEMMQEKCEVLKSRCFFNLPSNVQHINHVYSFFQRCFDIPEYRASLNAGIEGSVRICKSYVGRIKEIEDLEQSAKTTKNEMYIALITASITCLTFFNSSYTTLINLFHGQFEQIDFSAVIVTATFLATIATVVFNLSKQRGALSETRGKIKRLKSKMIDL